MDRILWCSQSNLCTTSPERGRKVLHRSQCCSVSHNPFQEPNSNPLHWWLKLWAFLSWQNVSYIQVDIWSMDRLWKALTAVFNSYKSFKTPSWLGWKTGNNGPNVSCMWMAVVEGLPVFCAHLGAKCGSSRPDFTWYSLKARTKGESGQGHRDCPRSPLCLATLSL